jgi:hypothetical protein
MANPAKPAYGMKLFVGGTQAPPADPVVRVNGVTEIKPPMRVNTEVKDTTEHLDAADPDHGSRQFMKVPVTDHGEVSGKLNRQAADAGQIAMLATDAQTAPVYWQVFYPDDTGLQFRGYLTKWDEETPIDGQQAVSFTIKVTGKPAAI